MGPHEIYSGSKAFTAIRSISPIYSLMAHEQGNVRKFFREQRNTEFETKELKIGGNRNSEHGNGNFTHFCSQVLAKVLLTRILCSSGLVLWKFPVTFLLFIEAWIARAHIVFMCHVAPDGGHTASYPTVAEVFTFIAFSSLFNDYEFSYYHLQKYVVDLKMHHLSFLFYLALWYEIPIFIRIVPMGYFQTVPHS